MPRAPPSRGRGGPGAGGGSRSAAPSRPPAWRPASRRSCFAWSPRNLLTGSAPQEEIERHEIVARVAGVACRPQQRLELGGQGKLQPRRLGGLEREIDVLFHQRGGEGGR